MKQTWHDLLFAHWPVPEKELRPLMPSQFALETFEGRCWVGVIPFWMSGVRPRGIVPIPGLSKFPELNVRTYVTVGGKPGVYFFSLDAGSRLAVWGSRAFYHLPYFNAKMRVERRGTEIRYSSRRRQSEAEFRGRYRCLYEPQHPKPRTIEYWLTERYCLYTIHQAQIYRCEIHHPPWPLQKGEAHIEVNTMTESAGISLPQSTPLLHFSARQDVLIWPLRPVRQNERS